MARRPRTGRVVASKVLGGALLVAAQLSSALAQELTLDTVAMVKNKTVYAVDVVGTTVYLAGNDLTILDAGDPRNPQLLSQIGISGTAADVQVVGNHAFVAAGGYGVLVIDVSNPKNPVQAARYDTADANALQIVGTQAYLADGGGGWKCLDISNPLNPKPIGVYDVTGYTATATTVQGQRAYGTYGTKGMRVLDVSNPTSPQLLGSLATVKSARNVQVRPPFAYLAVNDVGLKVVEISDPGRMEVVGTGAATDARRLELSGHYAYVADGTFGLRVFDIADPRQPKEAALVPSERAVVDVRVNGDLIYLATGAGGLTILQQTTPPEISAHPQNAQVKAGASVAFSVDASGSPAPAFQWQASGDQGTTWLDLGEDAWVAGATTRTLTLNHVPETWNQLWVRVQVSNKAGSAFSLPATLTVEPDPANSALELGTPRLYAGFMVHGEKGKTYRIEFLDGPKATEWQLAEIVTQTEVSQLWIDRSAPASGMRLYRAVTQP